MTQKEILTLITSLTGHANVIPVPRAFIALMAGDWHTAGFLVQLLYWTERTEDPDGWIAHTYQEWEREILLTENHLLRARRMLEDMGILETCVRRFQGAPTVHWRIVHDVFLEELMSVLQGSDFRKTGNGNPVRPEMEILSDRKSISGEKRNLSTQEIRALDHSNNSRVGAVPRKVEIVNSENTLLDRFAEFWTYYPRREGKAEALKSWKRIHPDAQLCEVIRLGVERYMRTEQWQRSIIPHPATFLNKKRWIDEPAEGSGFTPGSIQDKAAKVGDIYDQMKERGEI